MMAFVILHYMSIKPTLKLVDNLLSNIIGEKKIIIVDNASSNGSGLELKHLFEECHDVDVLINEKNLGFAKGCNIGYRFARLYQPSFIVLLNNDIEVSDRGFISKIKRSYDEERFDVMGPDIYVPETGIHQNPKKMNLYTLEQVKDINVHNRYILNQNRFLFVIRAYLKNITFLRRIKVKYDFKNKNIINNRVEFNVILHGSILIFSKDFIKNMDEPFNSLTFFYFETEIMGKILNNRNMISKYDPNIKVIHHQNTSTKEKFSNVIKRQKFQIENMVNSTEVYLKLFGSEGNHL